MPLMTPEGEGEGEGRRRTEDIRFWDGGREGLDFEVGWGIVGRERAGEGGGGLARRRVKGKLVGLVGGIVLALSLGDC